MKGLYLVLCVCILAACAEARSKGELSLQSLDNNQMIASDDELADYSSNQHEDLGDTFSQFALTQSDEKETEGLKEGYEVFYDYCVVARDFVSREIKKNMNKAAVDLFRFFFQGAEDVAAGVLDAQRMAVDRLSNQLLNPDEQIDQRPNAPLHEKIIVEAQRQIQEGKVQPHLLAFLSTLGAMGTKFVMGIQEGVVNFTTNLGSGFVHNLESGCLQFQEIDRMLKKKFERVRAELAETEPRVAKVLYSQIQCLTLKRISRIDSICNFMKLVKDSGPWTNKQASS